MRLLPLLLLLSPLSSRAQVTVTLKTSWPASPFAYELVETIGNLFPSLFESLIERMVVETKQTPPPTDRELYEAALDAIGPRLSTESLQLLKLQLGMRVAQPALQAHLQLFSAAVGMPDDCPGASSLAVKMTSNQSETVEKICLNNIESMESLLPLANDAGTTRPLPFDHVYAPLVGDSFANRNGPSVLLIYASLADHLLPALDKMARQLAENYPIAYVLRWRLPYESSVTTSQPLWLTGYGVELWLKSTEYKVTDDLRFPAKQLPLGEEDGGKGDDMERLITGFDFPAIVAAAEGPRREEIIQFRQRLISTAYSPDQPATLARLSADDFTDFSEKAISFILESPLPLQTLSLLAQDFPVFAQLLAGQSVNRTVADAIRRNQRNGLPAGADLLWLNGLEVSGKQLDVYGLVNAVRLESAAVRALSLLGLSTVDAVKLLQNSASSGAESSDQETELFDLREPWERQPGSSKDSISDDEENDKSLPGRGKPAAVIWFNNVEKDKRYRRWHRSLQALMIPSGGLPQIRRNLFNCIFVVDLTLAHSFAVLAESIEIIQRLIPIRFGFMPLVRKDQSPMGRRLSAAMYSLLRNYNRKVLGEFIQKVTVLSTENPTDWLDKIEPVYNQLVASQSSPSPLFNDLLADGDVSEMVALARDKAFDLSLEKSSLIVNGLLNDLRMNYQQKIMEGIQLTMQRVQQAFFSGALSDSVDMNDWLLQGAQFRRNSFITVSSSNPLRVIDLAGALSLTEATQIKYYRSAKDDEAKSVKFTFWIYAPPSVTEDGAKSAIQQTIKEALAFVREEPRSRVAIFCNNLTASASGDNDGDSALIDNNLPNAITRQIPPHINGKSMTIIMNGRVIGPFPAGYVFTKGDFQLLLAVEKDRVHLATTNSAVLLTDSDMAMFAYSIVFHLACRHASTGSITPTGLRAEQIRRDPMANQLPIDSADISIVSGNRETAPIHLVALVTPQTKSAQRLTAILESLSHLDHLFYIQITLNTASTSSVGPDQSTELPLKRFYRFHLQTEPKFTGRGSLLKPAIRFPRLPGDVMLTMGTEVPQAWVVMPVDSPHDLDNIRLRDIAEGAVSAELELKYILVEGHAFDDQSGAPPRGLQFVLSEGETGANSRNNISISNNREFDTIVMENLGYFQLKANPGVWNLRIREGRSAEFYRLLGVNDDLISADGGKVELYLYSFEGLLILPKVLKSPEKAGEELLSADSAAKEKPSWSNLFGWTSTKSSSNSKHPDNAEINVFSVASGHLYERMLRIMIQSVLQHTKHSVKFWFIEDFLSPLFKNFIPFMAEKFGFQFEMVTYKWPEWLRSQSEKQRTIWGYKILFLDVLFPLSLDKVIFVDADQVVRTDLKELVDMDLKGAPYGYTPFCESRKEIEGFRFWKVGYWKDHLRGRPYHISALYVVDLVRFRQMAAGDRLRQQYHMLSADPNSLANLDQDLPNDMQHMVPIHSLPQEWLWCETWCDDRSLDTAKTIDLCNNPMTKEPKLDRARRLLPEWNTLDQQARAAMEEWLSGGGVDKVERDDKKSRQASMLNDKQRWLIIAKPSLMGMQQMRYASIKVVKVPFLMDSVSEGELARWEKKIGEFVKQDELVATLETDKVDVQINSPESGVILEFLAKEGDSVQVGQDLLKLDLDGKPGNTASTAEPKAASSASNGYPASEEDQQSAVAAPKQSVVPKLAAPPPLPSSPAKKPAAAATASPTKVPQTPKPSTTAPSKPVQSPIVFSADTVPGLAPLPAEFRLERRVKMNRMRLRIAERLKESQNTAASLTTFNEVDMSSLQEFRNRYKDEVLKEHGVKLGFMSAFVKASVAALQAIPAVNGSIETEGDEGGEIVYHDYVDISVAVATPKGLVTPVLRNVERLSFIQVERAIAEFGSRARDGKISIEDMAGGTFTISNGGVFGSMFGTPIINLPQSAILGMHAVKDRPVVINGKIEIRPMMYLALTYDHRIIDGREAVTFLKTIKEHVEDPRKLLL